MVDDKFRERLTLFRPRQGECGASPCALHRPLPIHPWKKEKGERQCWTVHEGHCVDWCRWCRTRVLFTKEEMLKAGAVMAGFGRVAQPREEDVVLREKQEAEPEPGKRLMPSLDAATLKQQIVKRLRIDSERVRVNTGTIVRSGDVIRPYAFICVDRLTNAEEREVAKLIRETLPTGFDYTIEIAGGEKPLFLIQDSVLKPEKSDAESASDERPWATWDWAKMKMREGFWVRRKGWPADRGKIKRSIMPEGGYVLQRPDGTLESYAPASDVAYNDWAIVSKEAPPRAAKE